MVRRGGLSLRLVTYRKQKQPGTERRMVRATVMMAEGQVTDVTSVLALGFCTGSWGWESWCISSVVLGVGEQGVVQALLGRWLVEDSVKRW